jgi:hypothetical protein
MSVTAPWVLAGGARGQIGHCSRCGEALRLCLPQRSEVVLAAMRAFVKCHADCQPKVEVAIGPHRFSKASI